MSNKTNNYREQNGCHNCKFIFKYLEYDEGPEYYCNFDKNRPSCGSILLEENWPYHPEKKWSESYDAWESWAEKREINPCGICDRWEELSND